MPRSIFIEFNHNTRPSFFPSDDPRHKWIPIFPLVSLIQHTMDLELDILTPSLCHDYPLIPGSNDGQSCNRFRKK